MLERDPWHFTRCLIGITAFGATLVQLIFSSDVLTLECLGLCLAGIFLLAMQFQKEKFRDNPFSMLMLVGFGSTYFYLPLIFTTFELNPIHNKLSIPVEDFAAALSVFLCLILIQKICARYSLVRSFRQRFSHGVLKPLGFFTPPTELQLWGMGLIGLASFVVASGAEHEEESGALVNFFLGFRPFTFAPYLLLVPQMIGKSGKIKKSATVLIIYTAVLFCLAMATGARSYAVVGLVSVVCSYWLGIWAGAVRAPRIRFKHVLMIVGGVYLITGPLQVAFTAAKAGNSGKREDRSISEAFSDFVEAFSNKEILDEYASLKAAATQREGAWIETYVNNEFLRRFANLSFLDNTFSIALDLDESSRERLAKVEMERMIAILPNPIINFLGLDVDKSEFTGSMGDLLYNETKTSDTGLGSLKTGSVIASSYNLFGWGFPVMIALVSGGIFILMDCLAIRSTIESRGAEEREGTRFSTLGVLQSYTIFFILSSPSSVEAFYKLVSVLVRRHIQWLTLYAIVFWITYFLFMAWGTEHKQKRIPISDEP